MTGCSELRAGKLASNAPPPPPPPWPFAKNWVGLLICSQVGTDSTENGGQSWTWVGSICSSIRVMETLETIRLSLKTREWVTSLDFDAYFHISIAQGSRKYLRFFLFHQTFQFTALPFGLATAPLEFTKVAKEVKLMAQARGIRIHQYLDDWLLRAPYPEICLQHTQTLLALCRQLGWVVSMTKSELIPKQVFNFVGYRFGLITGRVLPTQDRRETLQEKLRFMKGHHNCTVHQFMSLIGLLTATGKQVGSGRLHMRPIQWHLKRNWHVPEVLEKIIPVPRSLHHLDWWLDEANVLRGHPCTLFSTPFNCLPTPQTKAGAHT